MTTIAPTKLINTRKAERALTAERLRRYVEYDPETGVFTWKPRTPDDFKEGQAKTTDNICNNWNSKHVGKRAGSPMAHGYWIIGIENERYLAHRLAWLYVHGSWPEGFLDHKNGDGLDNRMANLREATQVQNQANQKAVRGKSQYKGVTWHKAAGKWMAMMRRGGKKTYLGLWEDERMAALAYAIFALRADGDFARWEGLVEGEDFPLGFLQSLHEARVALEG